MALEFRRIPPAADVAPYVLHFWVLAGETLDSSTHPVLPDGCGEIVLNLGPATRELLPSGVSEAQPTAMLVGQMTRPVRVVPGPTMRMVGVKLAPWGAAAVFGEEAAALRDGTASLQDLGAGALVALRERLYECRDDGELRGTLDAAIRARLAASVPSRLDRLARLARALTHAPTASLDAWTRSLGCSARTLERQFGRWVGLSPKEFARLLRFQRALRLAAERPGIAWAVVAARAGYSDQAHLGRDFRQFAGAAPTAAAAQFTSVSAAFVE
jgi:AraC-like DNA-binding protein